ncbi:MAG TPA: ferric reductase-like transmembrane domain-containing protein [Polyangiaceae bacterium]|nr:ferric reductase-like transmembrane domain-containing protein [Polyangiaceae bacterium]
MPRPASLPPSVPPSSGPPVPLDAGLLELVQQAFADLAGPDSVLDSKKLMRSLDLKSAFIAERVLLVFDRNRDGLVNRVEFVRGVPRLLFGSTLDKLKFVFRVHDLNADGAIDAGELTRMLELALGEDDVPARPEVVRRLSELLLGAADANHDGLLSFGEFEAIAAQHPEATALISRSEASWIAPRGGLTAERSPEPRIAQRFVGFVDDNPALAVTIVLWAAVNVGLFVDAVLRYRAIGESGLVQLARGSGACINLNGALIALTMARRSLTWARRVPFLRRLPLDDSVGIHRGLGIALLVFALVHSAAHGANYAVTTPSFWATLSASTPGKTGALLLLVFGVMALFSRRKVRASGRFELFHVSHLLYVPWFALALAHGAAFWKWAGVPLAVFAVDRLLRFSRSGERAKVLGCDPLVSGVTRLTLAKPARFSHRAGEYVYLKVPALAAHEWHPFTISSAPEQPDLTLHVRSLGNFTSALYELARARSREDSPPALDAYLDGPFGTASDHIFESRHAVLIGAGIGVTPFASVLESIVLRSQAGRGTLEKVDFYWLNRDAVSFEWFAKLLASIERSAPRGLVEIRIFMTDGRGDISSTVLNLAREIAHDLGDPDVFTGLGAITRMGAPDFRAELSAIAATSDGEIDVFFCGPPGLGRNVRSICSELGLTLHQEQF